MRSRGATLIEVLVGCGIFAFLMLSAIAIMRIGSTGYKSVESKSDVTRSLNRLESDMVSELRRASLASVGVYTPTDDYHWAIWMKTPMNAPGCFDPTTGVPNSLGDPLLEVSAGGNPVMQRYVLYYVTRMDRALHQKLYGYLCSSYSNDNGPDVTCPHKWIVRKDIYLLDGKTTGNDSIGLQTDSGAAANIKTYTTDTTVTESGLNAETEVNTPSSTIHRVQVVAQNVLSFEVTRLALNPSSPLAAPTVSPTGPIVLFDVKVFKTLQAGDKVAVGQAPAATVNTQTVGSMNMVSVNATQDAQGTTNIHANSSIVSAYGAFTIQLDNRVIPQNK